MGISIFAIPKPKKSSKMEHHGLLPLFHSFDNSIKIRVFTTEANTLEFL